MVIIAEGGREHFYENTAIIQQGGIIAGSVCSKAPEGGGIIPAVRALARLFLHMDA